MHTGRSWCSAAFILEYLTLAWNVAGIVVLAIAARRGLRLIGYAFDALALYLLIQSTLVLAAGYHPRHSPLGIGWTAVTAVAMFALAAGKARGRARSGQPGAPH
jgi:hypothetical protein